MRILRVAVVLMVMAAAASDAPATVTLTASRTDVLYTTDTEFNCPMLAQSMDADLPYNVVRIRAEDDTGQATTFRWKLPKPNVGFLLRDDPEFSSAEGAFAVQGFCTDVGSPCVLTEDTIDTYRRATILWAGPTCDTGLPNNTRTQFGGDTVRIRVKADGQRGRAAKASIDVGYGRLGTPTLWISNLRGVPESGLGVKQVITDLLPTFSVTMDPAIVPPLPVKDYLFDNGSGTEETAVSCNLGDAAPGAAACTRIVYDGVGPFRPFVEVRLQDDSAYCDNLTCRVATCRARGELEVDRSPAKRSYRTGDQGELTVTLHNRAPKRDGCTFIFAGLECETAVAHRGFEDRDRIGFAPARCENNPLLLCSNDLECGVQGPCLDESHCSKTTGRGCDSNRDCSVRHCPTCQPNEQCVHVVQVPAVLQPGESAVLVNEPVELRSVFPGKTSVTETWTVHEAFGRGEDTTMIRYKIRGKPVP